MSSQWYYRLFGEEFGPIEFEGLTGLRDSGMLGDTDQVRPADSTDWITLTQALSAPPPAPTATATAPPKPQSEADTDDGWYYELAGTEMGPFTFEELIDLAERGSLTADDQVKMGRHGKYRRAGSIGRLLTHLPYAEAAATPAPPTKSTHSTPIPETPVIAESPVVPPPAPLAPPSAAVPMVRHHPAAEEPEWYAWIRGIEMGPTSLLQLAQWVKTGQIAPTDLVRCGKSGTWLPPTPTIEQSLARLVMVDMAPSPPAPVPQYTAPAVAQQMPAAAPPPAPARKAPPLKLPEPPPKDPVPAAAAPPRPEPAPSRITPPAEPPRTSPPESRPAAPPPSRLAEADPPKSPTPEPRPAYSPPAAAASATVNGSGSRPGSYGGGGGSYGGGSSFATASPAKPAYKPPPKKSSGGGGGFSFSLGDLFKTPEDQAKAGGVVALLLLLGWLFLWPQSTSEERKHLELLQTMVSEFQAKREAKANKIEMDLFANEKSKEIRTLLEKLQPKATGEFPARQNLVFAMQQIPRMMESSRDKPSPAETQVEYFLKKAAFLLGKGEDPDKDLPPPDPNATDPSMGAPT